MSKAELLDSTLMMIDGKQQRAFPGLRRLPTKGFEYARSLFDYVCFWGWQSAAKEAPKVGWRSDDPWVIKLTKYMQGG